MTVPQSDCHSESLSLAAARSSRPGAGSSVSQPGSATVTVNQAGLQANLFKESGGPEPGGRALASAGSPVGLGLASSLLSHQGASEPRNEY